MPPEIPADSDQNSAGQPRPEARSYGLFGLIWSDYERHCWAREQARRFTPDVEAHAPRRAEGPLEMKLKWPLRVLVNTTLRAQVLVRLTNAAPIWLHRWVMRSILLTLHSCEIYPNTKIGPRLLLPHPFGIGIGGACTIGENAIIAQNVTLATDLDVRGQPQLGDDVVVLPGALIAGPVQIGDGAVIGANAVVLEDVPPGGVIMAPKSRLVSEGPHRRRARPGGDSPGKRQSQG